MKTVKFRGQDVAVDAARAMIAELSAALAQVDPVVSASPDGLTLAVLTDPRWYSESSKDYPGSLLCFREPGQGWKAFALPWSSVAHLISLLAQQLAASASPAPAQGPVRPAGGSVH